MELLAQARTIVDIKKCANVRERPFDMAVPLAIAEYATTSAPAITSTAFDTSTALPRRAECSALARMGQWVSDAPIEAIDDTAYHLADNAARRLIRIQSSGRAVERVAP